MSNYSYVDMLIEELYGLLEPEHLFSRAKEYSWQTFFHHCVSTALISYRLGLIIKKNAYSTIKLAIESMERSLGIEYEKLLFLAGVAHDYVKLFGKEEKTGEEVIRNILSELLDKWFVSKKEAIISKILLIAKAVEGRSVPELEEEYIIYVAPIVEIADKLMSIDSVDEAILYLYRSIEELKLKDYGVRFGYIKTSTSSILLAKISEKIIDIISSHGWIPLVTYYNGVVFVGDRSATNIPGREIQEVVEKEVISVFEPETQIRELITLLQKKQIKKLYGLLEQTGASKILSIDKEEYTDPIQVYHDFIVKYIKGVSIQELNSSFSKVKNKLGQTRGSLIDPRSLATGLGRGSVWFSDKLRSMIVSKDVLVNIILTQDKENRFLLLSYIIAFSSKEEEVVGNILRRVFGVFLPPKLDPELLRIIAIAEVYRNLEREDVIRKLVESVLDELKASQDIGYYVSRFIASTLKSDIIDMSSLNSLETLLEGARKAVNYCRICNEPLLSNSIRFIEYTRVIGRGGGGSEIWLHDDPPLVSLEDIATNKPIRYICPLCYYEAIQLREGCIPSFFVVALHPVVSYDLWLYVKNKLVTLQYLYSFINRDPFKIAEVYKSVVETMKVTQDVISALTAKKPGEGKLTTLFDHLGAKVIIPLGTNMSVRKRDVAMALALAPFVMSAAGGGQVALVSNITGLYSMGQEYTPVIMPHNPPIVLSIVECFEKIKIKARIDKRPMKLSEYKVYNTSYIALLETLFIYGLKLFGWYARWKKTGRGKIDDYALDLYEYTSSIPYTPLALVAPPPMRLDPRSGDEPLPYYSLISSMSRKVESYMAQVYKSIEGKEPTLNKALYIYAKSLKEIRDNLSKHTVQKPLRKAINFIVEYASVIGSEDAKKLAGDNFISVLEISLGVNLSNVKKKIEDKEVSYAQILRKTFEDIADVIINLMDKLPPGKLSKFIEVLLDVAYEKYKSIQKEQ